MQPKAGTAAADRFRYRPLRFGANRVFVADQSVVGVDSFEPSETRAGLQKLLLLADDPATRSCCEGAAERDFSFEVGDARRHAICSGMKG